MGFTTSKASDILSSIFKGCYIGLHVGSSAPTDAGQGFSEPSSSTGYERSQIGELNTSIQAQIANDKIIFFNESIGSGYGTVTHFGCFSDEKGGTPFFIGELTNESGVPTPMNVGPGYVPIFRAENLIIGLDKNGLDKYD